MRQLPVRAFLLGSGLLLPVSGMLLSAAPAHAQDEAVRIEASLSAPRIAVGETVVLNYVVRTSGAAPSDIRLPQLAGGLTVAGTRQSQQVQLSFPGGRSRVIRQEMFLSARRPGRYAIPPLVAIVEGRRYASRPLTLQVTDGPVAGFPSAGTGAATGMGGELIDRGPAGEALLRTTLEPDTVWVGQQVTLRSDALFADEVRGRLRRSPEFLPPEVAGAWSYDLPELRGARIEWMDGRRYEVHSFRRAFFPIDAGVLEIPAAQLIYEVRRGFLFTPETERLRTPPLSLVVKPLPDGAPTGFTGAVGQLSLSASLSTDSVAVGEAALLTLRVSGTGNVKALPAPRLPEGPWRFEAPSQRSDFSVDDGRIAGSKTFEWVVVPERSGPLELGPIRYPYFDPYSGQYVQMATDTLHLRVSGASVAAAGEAGDGLRLRSLSDAPASRLPRPSDALFAALLTAPFLLLGLAFGALRVSRRERKPSRRAARRRLRSSLRALRGSSTDDRAFAAGLRQAALHWLAERFDAPSLASARGAALARELASHGAPESLAAALADLLDRVERAPYRPARLREEERQELVDRVEQTLERLDRLGRRRGRGPGAPAAIVVLMLAAAPAAAAPGDESLAEGLRLFEAGRRADAIQMFEQHVRENPSGAGGWYVLGTARAAAGEPGGAVLALLRALERAPRHDGTLHNLAVLGVDAGWVAAVRPSPPLSSAELRWLLVALGWCCALPLAIGLRRHATSRTARPWVVAGVAVAGVSLLIFAAHRATAAADLAVVLQSTQLRIEPTLRADSRAVLEEAQPVRVVATRDGWLRVQTGSGGEGWIERARADRI